MDKFLASYGGTDSAKQILKGLAEKPVNVLRDSYKPDGLKPLLPRLGQKRGAAGKNLGPKILFLKQLNAERPRQALFPGPNLRAWKRMYTTSMLALVVHGFMMHVPEVAFQSLIEELQETETRVYDVLTQHFGLDPSIGTVADWRNKESMTCRPLTLLATVFPRVLGLLYDGSVVPCLQ